MFLYDMLNEKSKEVHNNIRDMQKAADKQKASIDAERGFHAAKDNTDPDKKARIQEGDMVNITFYITFRNSIPKQILPLMHLTFS